MQTDERVDLFSKPAEAGPSPALADGRPPRGQTAGGWVRTTGWLQVGHHPVSSAGVAAVVGLLWSSVGAAVLVRTAPIVAGVLVVTTPLVFGASWWFLTALVRPASAARNIGTKPAGDLTPGDLVRLYGSIGPVGQVAAVSFGENIRVTFHGGAHQSWPRREAVHLVELLS